MKPSEEASTSEFQKISQLYARVGRDLPQALKLEKLELESWSAEMDAVFSNLSRQEIVAKLQEYQQDLEQSGISVKGVKELGDQLSEFSSATYDDARKRVRALISKEGHPLPQPVSLGVPRVSQAMHAASALVTAVSRSLDLAEKECDLRMREVGTDSVRQMEAYWREMEASFDNLDQALGYLAGQKPAEEEGGDATA
jgi:hypothetical protein